MGDIGMEYIKVGKSPKSISLTQTSSRLMKEKERRTLVGERKRSSLLEGVNSGEENDYEIQRLSPSSRLKKMGFPQKLWLLLHETRHDIIRFLYTIRLKISLNRQSLQLSKELTLMLSHTCT